MNFRHSFGTHEFHGGYWAKGQSYHAGEWHLTASIAGRIGNLSYKFIAINSTISTMIKRVSLFSQSAKNKIGIMNIKLKQLL